MIKNIIDLLGKDNFYGISETIEIAKGRNKKPNSWKDVWNKIKRHAKLKK